MAADQSQSPKHSDHARGPSAQTASPMPKRRWFYVLWQVKKHVKQNKISMISGAVAFFSLLALFPGLIAIISIVGLMVSPEAVEQQLQKLPTMLPPEARDVVAQQLNQLVTTSSTQLGWGAILGVTVALGGASTGTLNLMKAINIAYDQPERRGFIKQKGIALLLTLGFIIATIVALSLVAILPAVVGLFKLGVVGRALIEHGRWPILAVLILLGLAVLYRVAPQRSHTHRQWVSWGALIATVAWIAASIGFSIYVRNFASFNETYGAIGGVVVLLLWLFISAFVILLGAELNAELERTSRRIMKTGALTVVALSLTTVVL